MKKALPIIIVLALIAAVGLGFFIGQRSNEPTIENPPEESSTPEDMQTTSPEDAQTAYPEESSEPELDLLSYFQRAYDYVWANPINYNSDYATSTMDLEALEFFLEADGYGITDEYRVQYINWKYTNYATNKFLLNFSGSYTNTVGVDKMYVYATPHDTLPPIGEFYKFDVIKEAQSSDDGIWMKATYQGVTIYYKADDLGELTHEEWQYAQNMAEEQGSFTSVNEKVYAKDTVNIRTEPNTSSSVLDKLYKGESIVRIGIGQGEYEGWSKVMTGEGKVLYISSGYLTTEAPETRHPESSGGTGGNGGATPPPENNEQTDTPPTSNNTSGVPDWAYTDPGYTQTDAEDFEDTSNAEHSTGEGTGAGLQING